MGKYSKRKKILVGVALLAALVGTYFLYHRDSYLEAAIRTYGSAILGVKVTLKSTRTSVTEQSIELRGLKVENPVGYHGKYLLELDRVIVKVDLTSLAREVIFIREISLEKPVVSYEKGPRGTNLDVLQRNADDYIGIAPKTQPKESTAPPAKEKRWIIGDFYLRDGKAIVWQDMLVSKTMTISIPDLRISDIGKRSNGATSADATKQVLSALSSSVGRAAGAAINNAAKGVGQEVGKGAKKIGETLKGLFGR